MLCVRTGAEISIAAPRFESGCMLWSGCARVLTTGRRRLRSLSLVAGVVAVAGVAAVAEQPAAVLLRRTNFRLCTQQRPGPMDCSGSPLDLVASIWLHQQLSRKGFLGANLKISHEFWVYQQTTQVTDTIGKLTQHGWPLRLLSASASLSLDYSSLPNYAEKEDYQRQAPLRTVRAWIKSTNRRRVKRCTWGFD